MLEVETSSNSAAINKMSGLKSSVNFLYFCKSWANDNKSVCSYKQSHGGQYKTSKRKTVFVVVELI